MKTLSQMLEEIEPVNDRFLRETFGDTNKYAFVDRASYDRMKQVAIELAKGLESQAVPFHEHDIIWDCKDVADEYLNSAKDIIGGGE